MPVYTEFPADRVVNVRWHKKKPPNGGPGLYHLTCGAWTDDLFYENPTNANVDGFAYWILYPAGPPFPIPHRKFGFSGSLYGGARHHEPAPGDEGAYWPVYEKYLWSSPASWTVTYEYWIPFLRYYIGLWRGISLNSLMEFGFISQIQPNETGPASFGGASMEVTPQETDNGFPVIFGLFVLGTTATPDSNVPLLVTHSIPSIVQAHCDTAETTIGAPPPAPAYIGDTPPEPPYDNYILQPPYPVP